jgi:hypothetical protein
MSEKKIEESAIGKKDVDYDNGNVHGMHAASRRKSSAVDPAIIAGEIFDERYETTKRGLKSRYSLPFPFSYPYAHIIQTRPNDRSRRYNRNRSFRG